MGKLLRNELEELKRFFVEGGWWTDGLFQILFLLEDVKPGVDLGLRRKRRKLKRLRSMLYWFDLYVSTWHGGYATKNKDLYNEWNRVFGFKMDAERFLGYPSCCVLIQNLGFGSAHLGVHLYSIIKDVKFGRKTRQAIQQFLINLRFLHHFPCKISQQWAKPPHVSGVNVCPQCA